MSKLFLHIPSNNKAKEDIDVFMSQRNFRNIAIRCTSHNSIARFFSKLASVLLLTMKVKRGDVLLMQYPFKKYYQLACNLCHMCGGKVITLVHDLGCCRRKKLTKQQEIRRLGHTDVLIVHNEAMQVFLQSAGYQKPMLTLGIFDYLAPTPGVTPSKSDSQPWEVVYAGGLARRKNAFLYQLDPYINGWHFNIYGKGLEQEEANSWQHITPMGFVKSDDFIHSSKGHFGLVWDGNSIDACEGEWGNYLRINNPHKTSFYLRSGKPVIMWDKAALTPFILQHGAGIAVSSLREIGEKLSGITPEAYKTMCRNALTLSQQLQDGHHFHVAFDEAMKMLPREK